VVVGGTKSKQFLRGLFFVPPEIDRQSPSTQIRARARREVSVRSITSTRECSWDAIVDHFFAASMSPFMNDLSINGDLSTLGAGENCKVLQGQMRRTFQEVAMKWQLGVVF
jgi:hypothetical protein